MESVEIRDIIDRCTRLQKDERYSINPISKFFEVDTIDTNLILFFFVLLLSLNFFSVTDRV